MGLHSAGRHAAASHSSGCGGVQSAHAPASRRLPQWLPCSSAPPAGSRPAHDRPGDRRVDRARPRAGRGRGPAPVPAAARDEHRRAIPAPALAEGFVWLGSTRRPADAVRGGASRDPRLLRSGHRQPPRHGGDTGGDRRGRLRLRRRNERSATAREVDDGRHCRRWRRWAHPGSHRCAQRERHRLHRRARQFPMLATGELGRRPSSAAAGAVRAADRARRGGAARLARVASSCAGTCAAAAPETDSATS